MSFRSRRRHIGPAAVSGALLLAMLPLSVWAGSDGRRMTLGANRAYDEPAPGYALPIEQMAGAVLPTLPSTIGHEHRDTVAESVRPPVAPIADTPPIRVIPPADSTQREAQTMPEAKPAPTPAFTPQPSQAAASVEDARPVSASTAQPRKEPVGKVTVRTTTEPDRVRVTAPASKVTVRSDKVRVDAPYARVAVDEGRVRVRAPFVDLDIRF